MFFSNSQQSRLIVDVAAQCFPYNFFGFEHKVGIAREEVSRISLLAAGCVRNLTPVFAICRPQNSTGSMAKFLLAMPVSETIAMMCIFHIRSPFT